MASLSEELAKLANPTPVFKDPEDDIDDETAAKIVEKDYDDDFDDDDNQFSQLRRQTAAGLADSDNRYAGTKVTRKALKKISNDDDSDDEIDQSAIDALEKSLRGGDESMDDEDEGDNEDEDDDDIDDDEDDNDDDEDDNDDDDDDDAIDDSDLQKFRSKLSTEKNEFSFEDDGDYSKYADDDDDDDGGSEEDDDDDDEDDDEDDKKEKDTEESEIEDDEEEQEDGGIESFSRTNQSEEIQKGKAAQSQLGLWDNLLEERIKVQKVASVINQLPQPATWDLFVEQGGDNYMQAVTEAQSVLKKLLEDLLRVQTLLLLQNQETRHVVDGSDPKLDKGSKPGSDDEEITSESETEITSESETESTPVVKKPPRQQTDTQGLKRKFKMSDYPDFLSKRHKGFATYRNETLHKWNDKTRLASGKIKGKSFSALEQSALKQIEQIMRDKDRLIRRTQLKRSGQRILGVEEKVEEENQRHAEDNQEAAVSASPGDDYDGEVFDDSDFYHQLLRELIERKTSELNDPVAISRQWLEIEKLRTKVKKKKVDTRASKGRKIRYDVHAKLVNFMAPIDNSTWSDEARNDLFKSLFGKTVKI
ncbi:protein AATF-like [Haliotis rufescens]|uniref:protein AATF-like n=1 Tax=Haliotis rufescens TaxID=6454 RepID=UPI00201FA38F|nr:protein AATF-like [Haliotis rufescens]